MNRNKLGKYGETIAKDYLERHAYHITASNLRLGRLEIDLIASKNTRIILFEIKTRFGIPALSDFPLSGKQAKNLKKAALSYAAHNHIGFNIISYDLILVIVKPNNNRLLIRHYKNIF